MMHELLKGPRSIFAVTIVIILIAGLYFMKAYPGKLFIRLAGENPISAAIKHRLAM